MSHLTSSTSSTEIISQDAIRDRPQWQGPYTASINIVDNDSLLNIFYLYQPAISDGDENDNISGERWDRERWWYKIAHVCRRWRHLLLGSTSYLGLCLVCTSGTPVADMLAHSPPLPLMIDYIDEDDDLTAEHEEAIFLALDHRDRVRRIRLGMPVQNLQKLILAIDEEYPMLEYLILAPSSEDNTTLIIPTTLQAPHLRHLVLFNFSLPRRSRLLTAAVGLVSLCLTMAHPSTYFHPNVLLQWLSSMTQLETLQIFFFFPVPSRDVEGQMLSAPIMTPVTFPNLHRIAFRGVSAYLEAVVRRIAAPRLESLQIDLFKQLTFSIPHLLQFMNTTENLRFRSAMVEFSNERVHMEVYPHAEAKVYALCTSVFCWHLDWQVSSAARILNALGPMFPAVEDLTLKYDEHSLSSEENDGVDRTEWRKLLRSFSNVKTLHVDNGLIKELSCCFQLEDGELPLELLPELQELTYSGSEKDGDAFTSFIDSRQNADRPVTLDHAIMVVEG